MNRNVRFTFDRTLAFVGLLTMLAAIGVYFGVRVGGQVVLEPASEPRYAGAVLFFFGFTFFIVTEAGKDIMSRNQWLRFGWGVPVVALLVAFLFPSQPPVKIGGESGLTAHIQVTSAPTSPLLTAEARAALKAAGAGQTDEAYRQAAKLPRANPLQWIITENLRVETAGGRLVHIAALYSLTGSSHQGAEAHLAGAARLQRDHNQRCETRGCPRLVLVLHDDGSTPQIAQDAAKRLVRDERVVAVLGPAASPLVLSVAQIVSDAGLVHLVPSATTTALCNDNRWRLMLCFSPDNADQAKAMLAVLEVEGLKNAWIAVEPGSVFAANLAQQIITQGEQKGFKLITTSPKGKWPSGTNAGIVVGAAPYTAITVAGLETDGARAIVTSDAAYQEVAARQGVLGMISTTAYHPDLPSPLSSFKPRFAAMFGGPPTARGALSYTALAVAAEAATRTTGPLDRRSLAQSLQDARYQPWLVPNPLVPEVQFSATGRLLGTSFKPVEVTFFGGMYRFIPRK